MAGPRELTRDARGRFVARPAVEVPSVAEEEPVVEALPDPRVFPTRDRPRWRLRVFDRCWPWRATRGEALRDAQASRLGRLDRDDRAFYLDACANVQRDPPEPRWLYGR